jgi:hypothetical protein
VTNYEGKPFENWILETNNEVESLNGEFYHQRCVKAFEGIFLVTHDT